MNLGCCGGYLQEFRVVIQNGAGESTMVTYDREENAKQLLDLIQKRCPMAAIGFTE